MSGISGTDFAHYAREASTTINELVAIWDGAREDFGPGAEEHFVSGPVFYTFDTVAKRLIILRDAFLTCAQNLTEKSDIVPKDLDRSLKVVQKSFENELSRLCAVFRETTASKDGSLHERYQNLIHELGVSCSVEVLMSRMTTDMEYLVSCDDNLSSTTLEKLEEITKEMDYMDSSITIHDRYRSNLNSAGDRMGTSSTSSTSRPKTYEQSQTFDTKSTTTKGIPDSSEQGGADATIISSVDAWPEPTSSHDGSRIRDSIPQKPSSSNVDLSKHGLRRITAHDHARVG